MATKATREGETKVTQTEVVMAGFGGQGLMLIGRLLAQAGLAEGKEVTWLPSYGPEMRGGTANCTVVISDHPVGSPLIPCPEVALVMNRPSLDKFADKVRPGGLLVVDSSLIHIRSGRDDIEEFRVPADDIALEQGTRRAANIVMLGAFVGLREVVGADTLRGIIEAEFQRKPQFIETNLRSFDRGHELAKAGKSDE